MTQRIRRLIADYKRVHELFNGKHPNIKIIDMEGSPPEKYILELKIKSIRLEPDGLISTVDIHSTELFRHWIIQEGHLLQNVDSGISSQY